MDDIAIQKPEDFVLSTGKNYSIEEFVKKLLI